MRDTPQLPAKRNEIMKRTKTDKRPLRRWMLIGSLVLGAALLSAFRLDYFEINKQLDIFANLYREVNLYYVDETQPGEMMDRAIDKMLDGLDPYTVYIPESRVEDFRVQTTGQYGGVGSTIRTIDDHVIIIGPYKDSPADKAGLKPGDRIISIDGENMVGKNSEDVSRLLKGAPGTKVSLTIERDGVKIQKELKRERIELKSVPYFGMMNEDVGYIVLNSFTAKASSEVTDAFKQLKKDHELKGVILDLRGNPGGLLSEAVNVCNIFIPKGQEVVSTRGRMKEMDQTYKTQKDPVDTEIPLTILINSGSASASEIVAGTIQDLDRGVIVGQRSYGKGLVQQSRQLSYGAQVKITIAKYYTPSGRCIQAINYAERNEDGSVSKVPDSLRTAFATANGRKVYDGGGIDPDVKLKQERFSNVLFSLVQKNLIFDFATQYVKAHPEIPAPGEFALTEQEYKDFLQFLEGKEYHYSTETEKVLEELAEVAEDEKYGSLVTEIEKLKESYNTIKKDDLVTFRDQISRFIEDEIVGQYYYQEGRIRQGLKDDPVLEEAIQILQNGTRYNEILDPA